MLAPPWAAKGALFLLVMATTLSLGLCTTAPHPSLRSSLSVIEARGLDDTNITTTTTTTTTTTPVQYRGVNLGGWLVLESWMYPEWWRTTGVPVWSGEWQFCEILGKEKARELLEIHWDTWLTKQDLLDLKSAGIQHLRVPVGYWMLGAPYLRDDEPYVVGGWKYLERAMGWCKEIGLQMVIDLHGAPGSQNGHDNCGFSGPISWNQPENYQRTNEVLVYLAKNLTALNDTQEYQGVVVGLCLLNEPWTTAVGGPITLDEVKSWAQTAIDAVLDAGWTGHIWYPDGFLLAWDGWKDFARPPKYQNVFADTHIYLMFDPSLIGLDSDHQTQQACTGYYHHQLDKADVSSGVVVGEWSMDFTNWSTDYLEDDKQLESLKKLYLAQAQLYGYIGPHAPHARGGFFWSFKSKGRTGDKVATVDNNYHSPWDFLAMWNDGVVAPTLNNVTLQCDSSSTTPTDGPMIEGGGQAPVLPPQGGGGGDNNSSH